MKKYLLSFLALVTLTTIGILPTRVSAASIQDATNNLSQVTSRAGTTEGDLSTVVGRILSTALTLVGIIFLILMVYAGYLWMTARGAEDQIEKSKSIISAAVIGLVLVMSAYAISVLVTGSLGNAGAGTAPDAACLAHGSNFSCVTGTTCANTSGGTVSADTTLCPTGQLCCSSS